jgi:hypothetical protein
VLQVVALDLTGVGLHGNLSAGSWPFLTDLRRLAYLSLVDNPLVQGSFPANMTHSLLQITASGTGAASIMSCSLAYNVQLLACAACRQHSCESGSIAVRNCTSGRLCACASALRGLNLLPGRRGRAR